MTEREPSSTGKDTYVMFFYQTYVCARYNSTWSLHVLTTGSCVRTLPPGTCHQFRLSTTGLVITTTSIPYVNYGLGSNRLLINAIFRFLFDWWKCSEINFDWLKCSEINFDRLKCSEINFDWLKCLELILIGRNALKLILIGWNAL